MADDFGIALAPWVWVDASAAIGIARRKGLDKVRHLDCQSLWVQDAVRERRLDLRKVDGKDSPSDIVTKFLDAATMNKHLARLSMQMRDGRAEAAPEAVVALVDKEEHRKQDQAGMGKVEPGGVRGRRGHGDGGPSV